MDEKWCKKVGEALKPDNLNIFLLPEEKNLPEATRFWNCQLIERERTRNSNNSTESEKEGEKGRSG